VLFELEGVSEELARKAMALAMAKLPLKTRVIKREEI
jgi:large subunit ribosomal protein L16